MFATATPYFQDHEGQFLMSRCSTCGAIAAICCSSQNTAEGMWGGMCFGCCHRPSNGRETADAEGHVPDRWNAPARVAFRATVAKVFGVSEPKPEIRPQLAADLEEAKP
jgi:hypothetical protein